MTTPYRRTAAELPKASARPNPTLIRPGSFARLEERPDYRTAERPPASTPASSPIAADSPSGHLRNALAIVRLAIAGVIPPDLEAINRRLVAALGQLEGSPL